MTVNTVELKGERFVILTEADFLDLKRRSNPAPRAASAAASARGPTFAEVTPLEVGGEPASDLLVRDRR